MGFLNFLKYNQVESELLDLYTQMCSNFDGMTSSDAKEMASNMLDKAIKASKDEGTYELPNNFGDILLGYSTSGDDNINEFVIKIQNTFQAIKKDGVSDEDIRLWWNMYDVERKMSQLQDDNAKFEMFLNTISQGGDKNKASEKIKKYHPIYGDPNDTSNSNGDDRPIPLELKNRVNEYIQKRILEPEKYKKDIEKSSSFNALIRREIKDKNL